MADAIKTSFEGKWKCIKSENFEEFLKAMEVNVVLRKMAASASPTCDIGFDGNNVSIKLHTTFWTSDDSFIVGEEFQKTTNGVKMTVTSWWEGDKLIVNQTPVDPAETRPAQKVVREIVNGELIASIYTKDIVCKRTFKKME